MAEFVDIRGKAKQTINLGGKQRSIKFDLNAYGELEDKYGTVQEAMEKLKTGNLKAVKTILWAGLIHEEAILDEITGEPLRYAISPYMVGSWITPDKLANVVKELNAAMLAHLPKDTRDKIEKQVAEAAKEANTKMAKVVATPEELIEQEKND